MRKYNYLCENSFEYMTTSESHKELSRVPRTISENYNGENLDILFEAGGTIMSDIIIYAGATQMKDLFGETWFSMDDFCKTMGYTRTKLQKKLTEEQKVSVFGNIKPTYMTEQNGHKIEHPIETVFESALYKLGSGNLSVAYSQNRTTKYKFIQILDSFEIRDNFISQKKTKRLYSVHLSKDLINTLFNGYNLIDLKDYRSLPNRKGYRKFYLNLAKMIFLIKYKVKKGENPSFTVNVDDLAKIFDVNIVNNHDRKKKVISILNAINKNLMKTRFNYEFIKGEGEKWAYTIKFTFDEETLQYFDEKVKAVISTQFQEQLRAIFLRIKGIPVYEHYKYSESLSFGTGALYQEFRDWIYSDANKEEKIEAYCSAFTNVMQRAPKDKKVNLAEIL